MANCLMPNAFNAICRNEDILLEGGDAAAP